MKPSKDLDETLEGILNKCPYSQASQSCVKFHKAMQSTKQQLLALIEQREREAKKNGFYMAAGLFGVEISRVEELWGKCEQELESYDHR